MFGRNGTKARPARSARADAATPQFPVTPGTLLAIVGQQSRVEGKLERFDGNMVATGNVESTATGRDVAKIREQDAHAGPRPVHLVENMRQSAQK